MTNRQLLLNYAGDLVEDLGKRMYGTLPSCIAELVANAWDADATAVQILIPFSEAITPDLEISVSDSGYGMDFAECQSLYLAVGRKKRKLSGPLTPAGRKSMGRKGFGKFSGFGIADTVTVDTCKGNAHTIFSMHLPSILASGMNPYAPVVLLDDATAQCRDGTTVRLSNLRRVQLIDESSFRHSLARHFTVLGRDDFVVTVNGTRLTVEDIPLQFRNPPEKGSWNEELIDGFGPVKWWLGFTATPLSSADDVGVAVYANGRMHQQPFFFARGGGSHSQWAEKYLTGEVIADPLDESPEDFTSTDRQNVGWDEPELKALLQWGRALLDNEVSTWSEKRLEARLATLWGSAARFRETIERFPKDDQRILLDGMQRISSVSTLSDTEADSLLAIQIATLRDKPTFDVLTELHQAEPEDFAAFADLLGRWAIRDIVMSARQSLGRLEAIRQLEKLIDRQANEVPDLHSHISDYPWLLHPTYEKYADEETLNRLLTRYISDTLSRSHEWKARRPDFVYLTVGGRPLVCEIKRADARLTTQDAHQIQDYVSFIDDSLRQNNRRAYQRPVGLLVGGSETIGSRLLEDLERSDILVKTWEGVLTEAKAAHRELLAARMRNAPDHPIIEAISTLADELLVARS